MRTKVKMGSLLFDRSFFAAGHARFTHCVTRHEDRLEFAALIIDRRSLNVIVSHTLNRTTMRARDWLRLNCYDPCFFYCCHIRQLGFGLSPHGHSIPRILRFAKRLFRRIKKPVNHVQWIRPAQLDATSNCFVSLFQFDQSQNGITDKIAVGIGQRFTFNLGWITFELNDSLDLVRHSHAYRHTC